ncbi:replicative DNA helicase [Candidatus Zixiibacteriota bacterium]
MANHDSNRERVPPQDVAAEERVLGAMLIDEEAIVNVVEILNQDDFYLHKHGLIFKAMLDLFQRNEPIDLITLPEQLLKNRDLDDIGGRVTLINLTEGVATSANVEYHANIIREKSVLRRLKDAATTIIKECQDPSSDPGGLLDRAEQTIFDISGQRITQSFVPISEVLPGTFDEIEEFHRRGGQITGLATGFGKLDSLTAGLHKGDLIVVAGRPSMGKTAFALNIAEHVAIEEKIPVGIFSLEMSKEQVALRMLCALARIDSNALRTGRLRTEEWPRLSAATGPLSEHKIFVDDSASLGILELRAKARRLKAQQNVGLILIDYMQMMRGPVKAENRQQEIAVISRSLKIMAKELNIPVVALSQLSRGPEQRGGDRRPQLADLRESGAIEQDADVVMFIYRAERYDIKKDKEGRSVENIAEIIVSKQRNGPTGSERLRFSKECVRFDNLATGRQPESVGPAAEEPVDIGGPETPF